jgi:O-antigen/teichoic acid export membrane protein
LEENKNLKSKTFSALSYSFGGFIVTGIIQFIVTIILARLLLPREFGLLGMIMIFIAISQIFVDSGMTAALIREKDPSDDDYSTVFYYNLILSILMYLLLFLSANFIGEFFKEPILINIIRVVGLTIIISSFGLIQRTMLIIKLDFKTQIIIEIMSVVLSSIVAVFMAYNGFGVWSLIAQILIRQMFISIMFSLHNKWTPRLIFKLESFRRLFNFGWKLLLTGILSTAYKNIYNLVIGKVYLSTQLGYYTKSVQLRDLAANSITLTMDKVSYPVLSKLQDNPTQFRANFRKIIQSASFFNFPMMILMIVLANPFISLLLGQNWLPMIPYFQILCLAGLTFPHRALNLNILKVVGRSDLFLKLDIMKILIGVISIGIVIFLDLGIYSLLWVSLFNTQTSFLFNTFFSKRYISYSTIQQIFDMIKPLLISVIMGVIVYITGYLITIDNFMVFSLQIIIGVISYLALCKIAKVEGLETILDTIKGLIFKTKK